MAALGADVEIRRIVDGKWSELEICVCGGEDEAVWYVNYERRQHIDGRIRDAHLYVEDKDREPFMWWAERIREMSPAQRDAAITQSAPAP